MKFASPAFAIVLAACLLAGCGKKPSFVDPPPGVSPDPFPRTYPNQVSEGGPQGRTYPTPESEGRPPTAAPAPTFPGVSADPLARIYRNPGTELSR